MLQLENVSPSRRRLIVALLAIASGVASYSAIRYSFLEWPNSITLVPGVIFGTVLAFAIAWKRRPDLAQSLIVIVLTTLAWYFATRCWMAMEEVVQPYFQGVEAAGGQGRGPRIYKFGLIGIVTGLVGAVLTWAAVAAVRPETRSFQLLVNVAFFGEVAGMASETIRYADSSGPMGYTAFLVFSLWQTGVALLLMNATMKRDARAALHR
jgi:uncharacterized membrane protein YfcA